MIVSDKAEMVRSDVTETEAAMLRTFIDSILNMESDNCIIITAYIRSFLQIVVEKVSIDIIHLLSVFVG